MGLKPSLQTYDDEDVTVDGTAGGVRLSLSKLYSTPHAIAATLTVQTAQIRWSKAQDNALTANDGGHVANVGTVLYIDNLADLVNFRAIRTGATSGSLHVEYHR